MKKNRYIMIAAAALLMPAACSLQPDMDSGLSENLPQTKIINSSSTAVQGSLLVKLTDAAEADVVSSQITASGISVRPLFRGLTAQTTKAGSTDRDLAAWLKLDFSKNLNLDSLASEISTIAQVAKVQFDTKLVYTGSTSFTAVKSAAATKADFSDFNDPQLGLQWNYYNNGSEDISVAARRGADINVADAWRLETGRPEVIIAVIDQGVQYDHPDLAQNMWVNTAELNGTEGQDDDGNGYEDDIYGYNFVLGTGNITWAKEGDNGHGTHVAGTVAAVNNNGIGVSGIAGGDGSPDSGVRIMSLQVFDGEEELTGHSSVVAEAFRYALANGASIIQCSFGYASDLGLTDNGYSSALPAESEALRAFINGKSNCAALTGGNIAIFAAGNDGGTCAGYPAALRDCIAVTAVASDGLPAYYTNHGPGCNIAAPGGEYYTGGEYAETGTILSTMPTTAITSIDDYGEEVSTPTYYGYSQGTSMACPHVSGVAALGLSYALDLGKTFSREEFVSLLMTSVNDIDSYLVGSKTSIIVSSSGMGSLGELQLAPYVGTMGTGTIDAWRMLMQIEGTPCLVAEAGRSQRINLDSIFGGGSESLTYLGVTISQADYNAIGLATAPSIKGGSLLIQPTQYGSAKLTIRAIGGGSQLGGGNNVGGMEITKEVSVIVRGVSNGNGGWL